MTREIAIRLAHIFKADYRRARYEGACINQWPSSQPFKNKSAERRFDRKAMMFDITRGLYLECRHELGLNHNEPIPEL
jgi:hypothetical protein